MSNPNNIKEWYNVGLKKEYVNTFPQYENDRTFANRQNIFNKTEVFESRYDKDVAQFNIDEAKNLLSGLGTSTKSLNTNKSLLSEYVDWCISNKKFKCENVFDKFNIASIDVSYQIRKQMFGSHTELHEVLDKAFPLNYECPEMSDMVKLICELLFMGLNTYEIINIKKKDIDQQNKLINVFYNSEPKIFTNVSDEVLNLCDKVSGTTQVMTSGGKIVSLKESNYLLRSVDSCKAVHRGSETVPYQQVHTKIKLLKQNYFAETGIDKNYTADKIWLSGMFFRWYNSETQGGKIDNDFVYKYAEENKLLNDIKCWANYVYTEIINEYIKWKKAFNI